MSRSSRGRRASPTFVPIHQPETLQARTPPPHVHRYSPSIEEGDAGDRHPQGRDRSPTIIPAPYSPPVDEGDAGGRRPVTHRTRSPTVVPVHGLEPERVYSPPPTAHRYSPPLSVVESDPHRLTTTRRTQRTTPPIHIAPSGRPLTPRTELDSQLRETRGGDTVIPVVHSEPRRPLPERPEEQVYVSDHPSEFPSPHTLDDARMVPSTRPRTPGSVINIPSHAPSGPGDLGYEEAEHARQERFEENERRWLEAARLADDSEERREQFFRDHEDERDRIFRENEDRRDREAMERRDEIYRTLEERLALPGVPPEPVEGLPELTEEELAAGGDGIESVAGSVAGSLRSTLRATPGGPLAAPQLDEILELLKAQRDELAAERATVEEERVRLREEAENERARANAEHESRVAALEAELARTREELELERGQRRSEELQRIEDDRVGVQERDDAVRGQLSDITNIVQGQREECATKKQLMEERWDEKQNRRVEKDAKKDALFDMVERLVRDREEEKLERERERAAEAERPGKS